MNYGGVRTTCGDGEPGSDMMPFNPKSLVPSLTPLLPGQDPKFLGWVCHQESFQFFFGSSLCGAPTSPEPTVMPESWLHHTSAFKG